MHKQSKITPLLYSHYRWCQSLNTQVCQCIDSLPEGGGDISARGRNIQPFRVFVSPRVASPAVLELQSSETGQAGLFVHTAQVVSQYEQRAQPGVGHGHMAAVVRMGHARTLRSTQK